MSPIFTAAAISGATYNQRHRNSYQGYTAEPYQPFCSENTQRVLSLGLIGGVAAAIGFSFVPVIGTIAGFCIGFVSGVIAGLLLNTCLSASNTSTSENTPYYRANQQRGLVTSDTAQAASVHTHRMKLR